jgi:flagellar protein FlaF
MRAIASDDRGGFSTSASLLIIFVGVFIALGSLYTAGSNAVDRVQQAEGEHIEQHNTVLRTSINVTGADWDGTTLTVRANNTGTTTLSVNETDAIVDGEYVAIESFSSSVDGDTGTDRWNPNEQLVLSTDQFGAAPTRVKLVTATGLAGTTEVSS